MQSIKTFTLVLVLFHYSVHSFSQRKIEYKLTNINAFNEVFNFKTYLSTDGKKKLYEAHMGMDQNPDATKAVKFEKKFIYTIYKESPEAPMYLESQRDNIITGYKDQPNMVWKIENDSKNLNGKTLNKATTTFRGRNYVAWYDPKDLLSYGPWKFDGLPGMIYEVSTEDGKTKWVFMDEEPLKSSEEISYDLKKHLWLPYTEYPKIQYAIPPKLKELMERDPSFKFKAERPDLEIKFEWEE